MLIPGQMKKAARTILHFSNTCGAINLKDWFYRSTPRSAKYAFWCGFHLVTQSCATLCSPMDHILSGPLSMGLSRQEYWSPCIFLNWCFYFLQICIPRVKLLDHEVILVLVFWRPCILFCILAVPFYLPTNSV